MTALLTLLASGHALRKNTAGAFGPDLARKLSQLVKMEKNVMRSMEMVSRERMETAVRQALIHNSAYQGLTQLRPVATTLDLGRKLRRRCIRCH